MKNSRTSQIAALVLLAISDIVLFLAAFGSMRLRNQICRSTAVCYFLLVVMMGALIYYIAMSKEKKFSIIISVIAVGAELLVTFLRAYITKSSAPTAITLIMIENFFSFDMAI